MTRNSFFKNSKSKFVLILLMIGVLCFSLFSVACNNSSSTDDDFPSYTYTEKDDGDISNPTFAFGTLSTELTAFPKTSVTGWTKSVDTNAKSLSSSYGIVNVSESGWEELMNALYKNDNVKAFATSQKSESGFALSDTEIKQEVKNSEKYNPDGDEDYTPTKEEIQEYVIDKYFKNVTDTATAQSDWLFANPGTRPGATDKVVYMLNNYSKSGELGSGSAQKITSSSEITLNKGEYGKISVWVKTQNLFDKNIYNTNYNANIRLINTFNGTTQSEYAITNIVADDWTEYVVYVKADEHFDCTIKLALGLGYGLTGSTEGTVYFDDIEFTHLDQEAFENATNGISADSENNFVYNAKQKTTVDAENLSVVGDATNGYKMSGYAYYNMSFENYLDSNADTATYFNTLYPVEQHGFTTSNTGESGDKLNDITPTIADVTTDLPYDGATARKITLEKQSYTFNWSSDKFKVGCEEYAYVSFFVKNQLSKLGSTDVTINVIDVNPENSTDYNINAAVASVAVNDDWQKVDLVIKNNFAADKTDDNGNPYPERTFKIQLVIGPSDVASTTQPYEYATGSVSISSLTIATGTLIKEDDATEAEERLYDLYSMFSSSASATISLYRGRDNDYTETTDTETYPLVCAPNDFGSILNYPTNVKGYNGIVANHFYVKEDADNVEKDTNTRTRGDVNGNYAGLINTKYLGNYNIDGLSTALNYTSPKDEENIQPIMIYNKVANHYGYVGEANTIAVSSYAKVSVTLRVVDDAVAYLYLVDVTNNAKEILTFRDFTDVDGNEHDGEQMKLMLKVDKDVMGNKNWITVNFYVATGASSKNFRVEVWNGGRDGGQNTASQGFVFVKDIAVTTSGAFTESSRQPDTFSVSGNPLFEIGKSNLNNLYSYERQLTELEEKYNSEKSGSSNDVSYSPNYVWAQNDTTIYAIYNTIDPVEVDPYENEETEDSVSEGCTAETDPSTFWLSFSSILLGVALVIAILMLFIKNIRRRRKANASDAKSHYKVVSRVKTKKDLAKKAKNVEVEEIVEDEQQTEDTIEENSDVQEENDETAEKTEEALDSYVYGDVEVFGEDGNDKKD